MFTDIHCHLNDKAFDGIVEQTVREAEKAGTDLIVDSGFDLDSSLRAASHAESFCGVYFSAGWQPQEISRWKDKDMDALAALCRHEKCVAVGEIGLDYHYPDNPEKSFQKDVFVRELELAKECRLPVVIHSRDCAEDMIRLLKENRDKLVVGGVMHCYSHSAEMVKDFLDLGFYLSFGGTATYTGSKKVMKSVIATPVDRILSETDSPYLTPEPHKGSFPNAPKYIPVVVERLAELKGLPAEALARRIRENAKTLFAKLPR